MPFKLESDNIKKEIGELTEILYECREIIHCKKNYNLNEWDLEELSKLYNRIENGLIGYNFIAQDNPDLMDYLEEKISKTTELSGIKLWGKFLESQLFLVSSSIGIRNKRHEIFKQFKDSLWNEKLRDREYYNQIFNLSKIKPKYKEEIYSLLQE